MLDTIPNEEEMTALVGKSLYDVWTKLCALIDEKYDMDRLWNKGGKAWKYEYKYRRGGKTLCALYARENRVGFMIILGKDERLKFETDRENYSRACLINRFGCRGGVFFRQMAQKPQGILCGFLRSFGTYDGKRRCPEAKDDLSNKP